MNDYIAGLIGGVTGLVVGHPLDTIKALIQTRDHQSIRESANILLKETKFKGFFRGLTLPFITYGPLNSLLFGVYGTSLKFLNTKIGEPSLTNVYIAGSIAGTVLTIPTNPLEVIKIQLQTHKQKEIGGLTDCVRQIYKNHGLNGFMKGYWALFYRDAPTYGLYFSTFEFLRRKGKQFGYESQIFIDLFCGGMAGTLTWLSIVPIDVVKSQLQANRNDNVKLIDAFRKIFRENGIRGFYKGTSALVIRAFLVNSITFCVYAQVLSFLDN